MKYVYKAALLALTLTLQGGFATTTALAGPGAGHAASDTQSGARDETTPIDETRPVAADVLSDVSNVRGAVNVATWDSAETKIVGSLGRGSKLAISGDSKHLIVRVEQADGADGSSWWHGRSGSPQHDTILNLSVPRNASLKVEVVSASAQVNGIGGKSLDIESVSGRLKLSTSAPDISVDSVSGDVALEASAQGAAAHAHIQTVSGDIEAGGLAGRIKLDTVSGNVRAQAQAVGELDVGTVSGAVVIHAVPDKAGRINLESMSGSLTLHVPPSLSAHIEVETFSGRVRSDFGEVKRPQYGPGSSLDVRLGDGDAHIEAQSFSGNIELHKDGG